MRRLLAIVALASLLGSPAALWTAAGCCEQPDCCRQGLCPLHGASRSPAAQAATDNEEQGMHCHAAKKSPKQSSPGCVAGASCNHSKQANLLAPIPRAVMAASAWLEAPTTTRAAQGNIASKLLPGFSVLPFNPPRPLA